MSVMGRERTLAECRNWVESGLSEAAELFRKVSHRGLTTPCFCNTPGEVLAFLV
jgi:hypothetical protein